MVDDISGWSTPREAVLLVTRRTHLRRTLLTAVIVGTVLFAINQLDVVLGGRATWVTWVKGGVTYLVPFAVANVGVLIGTRKL
ncbi:MAG: nitrate/nitrite transporter NrtS [Mycobacteriales bacterium]